MTKLYVTEFPGFGATPQSSGDVDVAGEPASRTTIVDTAATTGPIAVLGAITAGTLYTNGTYTNVPLTGGTGSGAQATIVVSGGGVTAVTLTAQGTGYTAADSLSAAAANIGGTGSGFAIPVSSITHNVSFLPSTRVVELEADGLVNFVVGQGVVVATVNGARLPANGNPVRRVIPAPTGQPAGNLLQPWVLSAVTGA